MNLLMSPRAARNIRGLLTTVSAAVRSVVAPATLVEQTDTPALAADPADVYTEADMPAVADIERAALHLDLANDNARRADRAKRAAKKILTRLPSGQYGNWVISRVASNRQVADLDAIRATYKANGWGPVPMKDAAPSLKVRRAELGAPADDDTAVLAAV